MQAFELRRQCGCLLIRAGRSFPDPGSRRRNSLGHSFSSFLQIKPNFCILFHMTPLFDIQSCHGRPCPGHVSSEVALLFLCSRASIMRSGGRVLRIISCMFRIDNAQWGPRPAHYQNCLTFDHQDSCELVPAVPSLPPCQPYRDNRPRSHPPHFASTASLPTHSPPQSIKMRRVVPTSPPFVLAVTHSSTSA